MRLFGWNYDEMMEDGWFIVKFTLKSSLISFSMRMVVEKLCE